MYKKQMVAQKVLCLAAVIMGAVVFVYSLGIMTDLYDALYSTMRNPNDLTQTTVPGSIVYYNMQDFNKWFVIQAIVLILLGCLLFVTNTHIRRRYYIGNYVATAAYAGYSVYLTVMCHSYIEAFKAQWLQVDFDALAEHAEMWNTLYTKSTFWFDVHYGVFAALLIVAVLLVANAVWKVTLMKDEARLIAKGKGALA